MMRVGLFKDVHVKTLTSQKRRALLMARALLQQKAIDLENEMRGLLRNFGLKVGQSSGGTFERRILELIEHDAGGNYGATARRTTQVARRARQAGQEGFSGGEAG